MRNSHDTKGNIRVRGFLSFVLCILLIGFSLALCARTVFTKASYIEEKLTSYDYVSSYRQAVIDFAGDVFLKNGIPADNLENVITYDDMQELAVSYINSVIKARTGYTAQTVTANIQSLQSAMGEEIKAQLENTGYEYDGEKASALAEYIGVYVQNKLSIEHDTYLETVTNVGSLASLIISIVVAVFCAILMLILFFVGAKRYRSVRAIGNGFMSAGIFDLFLSLIAIIILRIKSIDIYPLFLRSALMDYVYGSIGAVAAAGAIMIFISLIFVTVVWKMKRDE